MPILDSRTLEFFSRSAEQTRRLGMRLGSLLEKGDVVCLKGDLGSGKTTLVQGIAQGWGSLDPVTSPTFVIVNLYRRPDQVNLYHLDAYRLENAAEATDLDIELMLEQGAMVVEWPERIAAALPPVCLKVEMRWIADEQRGLVFLPQGQRYDALIGDFRRRVLGG
jgi:tRNA threonylcarbamoyladenosine biosynthesis protein TsaE